jgi:hypothetical protein
MQITMLGTNLKIYIFNNIKEYLWHFQKDVNQNLEDEKEGLITNQAWHQQLNVHNVVQ